MNFKTTEDKATRLEIHENIKSAIKSKARWEGIGFSVKIYFVNENTDDHMVGMEIRC